jgi:hypothetical protein
MRITPLVVITLAFAIDAQAQTRDASAQPAGKGRVETQAQCEARQQQIRDPVSGVRIQAGDAARFCSRQPVEAMNRMQG